MPEETYWSVAVVVLLGTLIPILILGLTGRIGPRTLGRRDNVDKLAAYECGVVPEVDARRRFSSKFYLVAVLFVLFDVEVAFLVPWGVTYRALGIPTELGWGVFLEMVVFLGLLAVGLFYVIKRGALEWE